ncbi:MAG: hypothetical protein LBG11_11915, partial [Bifidobacteriaceae bacterium]|nr:hypothetical protein [Bifidobacteriaceae bacterium]
SLTTGNHQFTVTYTDALGQEETVEFTVTVQGAPRGQGRNIDLPDDRATGRVSPLDDVTGTNLRPLTAGSYTNPEHGTLELDGADLKYTPEQGWSGQVWFQVTVCDDLDQCAKLDYSFTIGAQPVLPDPPTAAGASALIPLGGTATLAGTATADTAHGAAIASATVTTEAAWIAEAVITPTLDGQVGFQANALPGGGYQFTVRYTDNFDQSADAVYTVTVQAPPLVVSGEERPVALGGQVSFPENVTTTGQIASRAVTKEPAAGRVELGSVIYQAETATPAHYPFEVTYTDNLGQTAVATYIAWVLAKPTAAAVHLELTSDSGELLVDPVGAAWVDGAGTLVVDQVVQPAHGSVVTGGDGELRYVPPCGLHRAGRMVSRRLRPGWPVRHRHLSDRHSRWWWWRVWFWRVWFWLRWIRF